MKYKNILITGKNGTVGQNLNIGYGFSSAEYDLKKQEESDKLISQFKPDAVIHCAARVGGLKFHIDQKYKLFYDNIAINTNIIESCRKNNINRILSYLSSCIFSDLAPHPYSEESIHHSEPASVHYPYGHSKRMLEVQSRICYEEFGLFYNCVVPTNIYGLHDNFNKETAHVVAGLIRRAFEAAESGVEFVVWGDGKQQRDFIFTEDISKLTYWALENYFEKEPLIFSSNSPTEIGYIAYLIAKKFNIENKLKFDTTKPSGQKIRKLNGNKLSKLSNFQFTPIEEGISQSVDWFVKNYPNIRL